MQDIVFTIVFIILDWDGNNLQCFQHYIYSILMFYFYFSFNCIFSIFKEF